MSPGVWPLKVSSTVLPLKWVCYSYAYQSHFRLGWPWNCLHIEHCKSQDSCSSFWFWTNKTFDCTTECRERCCVTLKGGTKRWTEPFRHDWKHLLSNICKVTSWYAIKNIANGEKMRKRTKPFSDLNALHDDEFPVKKIQCSCRTAQALHSVRKTSSPGQTLLDSGAYCWVVLCFLSVISFAASIPTFVNWIQKLTCGSDCCVPGNSNQE